MGDCLLCTMAVTYFEVKVSAMRRTLLWLMLLSLSRTHYFRPALVPLALQVPATVPTSVDHSLTTLVLYYYYALLVHVPALYILAYCTRSTTVYLYTYIRLVSAVHSVANAPTVHVASARSSDSVRTSV